MDLKDRVRAGLDFERLQGMEIGPLYRPFVQKLEGSIIYVDHADTETLRAKYAGTTDFSVDDIVDVDAVWGEQTLSDCLVARKVDYVIASHVVEHVPDFITWLNELQSVLNPTGEIRLVVPDKRFTFDYARQLTDLADVLDAYLRRARSPLPRCLLDHFLNVREIDASAAWAGPLDVDSIPRADTFETAFWTAKNSLEGGAYVDAHCWVFTPASFARLMREAAEHDLLHLACSSFEDTIHGQLEFLAFMRPSDSKAEIVESWRQMEKRATNEPAGSSVAQIDGLTDRLKRLEEDKTAIAARLHQAEAERDAAQDECERLKAELQAIRLSSSWRITAPLRAAAHRVRRTT